MAKLSDKELIELYNTKNSKQLFGVTSSSIVKTTMTGDMLSFYKKSGHKNIYFSWIVDGEVRITESFDELHDSIESATISFVGK